jgi:hypothetical protein
VNESVESRLSKIKFSASIAGADRIHHVNADDVRTVLSRLPLELWHRLRAVHFNDRSRGGRVFGYADEGLREISLCALPPRMGLTLALAKGQSPEHFGASRAQKWPVLAIRRFMLYDVLYMRLDICRSSMRIDAQRALDSPGRNWHKHSRCSGASDYGRLRFRTRIRSTTHHARRS